MNAMRLTAIGLAIVAAGVLGATSRGGAGTSSLGDGTVLVSQGCEGGACESFPLDKAEVGSIFATNVQVETSSGERAGRVRTWCTVVRGVGWPCNVIVTLKRTPQTQRGIITASGLSWPLSAKGEVNTFAITGGAGDFVGARGYATNGWDRTRKAFVLKLYVTKD